MSKQLLHHWSNTFLEMYFTKIALRSLVETNKTNLFKTLWIFLLKCQRFFSPILKSKLGYDLIWSVCEIVVLLDDRLFSFICKWEMFCILRTIWIICKHRIPNVGIVCAYCVNTLDEKTIGLYRRTQSDCFKHVERWKKPLSLCSTTYM